MDPPHGRNDIYSHDLKYCTSLAYRMRVAFFSLRQRGVRNDTEMALILIMEDDVEQASLLKECLSEMRHEAIVSHNANDALRIATERRPDLLISDIFVRDKQGRLTEGGVLLIGRIRNAGLKPQTRWMADLPVIAITGARSDESRVPTLEIATTIGASKCMEKPISFSALRAAVDELLENVSSD